MFAPHAVYTPATIVACLTTEKSFLSAHNSTFNFPLQPWLLAFPWTPSKLTSAHVAGPGGSDIPFTLPTHTGGCLIVPSASYRHPDWYWYKSDVFQMYKMLKLNSTTLSTCKLLHYLTCGNSILPVVNPKSLSPPTPWLRYFSCESHTFY